MPHTEAASPGRETNLVLCGGAREAVGMLLTLHSHNRIPVLWARGWCLLVACAAAVSLQATAAPVLDSDLVAAAHSHPGRWEQMRNISFAWRGSGVRVMWALPTMAAVYEAQKQGDAFNETAVAGFDSPGHKYLGDFRMVSSKVKPVEPCRSHCTFAV
jgi:hypothetical protein